MMMTADQTNRRQRYVRMAFTALGVIAFAFFSIQAWRYAGITRAIAEWQFGRINLFFPMGTIILLALLILLPVLLIALIIRARRRREPAQEVPLPADDVARMHARNRRFVGLTQATAAFAFAGAIIFGITYQLLPQGAPPATIANADIGRGDGGPIRLAGQIDTRHVVQLDRRQLLAQRDLFIAPVYGRTSNAAHYFIEVTPLGSALEPIPQPIVGQLGRDTLPREALPLFAAAGVRIAPDARIIYQNSGSLGWPYLAAASQFLIVGLFALLFAALLRWRRRRFDARVARIDQPAELTRR
jgi:hypothetical protein